MGFLGQSSLMPNTPNKRKQVGRTQASVSVAGVMRSARTDEAHHH